MSLGETVACLSRNLNSYLLALPTTSCNSRLWRDLPTTVTQTGKKKKIMASLRTGAILWGASERLHSQAQWRSKAR